ncbi:PHA/PHB synthase family protein [Paroceanicella profunda]|nr:class I poly(R)-hydroxyalkanoic acid synthase [Paroceanicella profunda]
MTSKGFVSEEYSEQAEAAQVFAHNMALVAEQSQQVWSRFLDAKLRDSRPVHGDPLNTLPAFNELGQAWLHNPEKLAEQTLELWNAQLELWRRITLRFMGGEDRGPMASPARGDRRFRHEDWSQNVLFDYLKQSYLLTSTYIQDAVASAAIEDDRDRRKVAFYTRQFVEAMNPANFYATNPEVLHATMQEKGENLVRGMKMMLEDLERGRGNLLIRQTDMTAFAVGRNMAMTPGKVIFENHLFQLIQYAPVTEKVHATPLLILPPWINKFYILDLNEQKSLVRWLVAQGHTVFMVSWVNPDERQKDETWATYMFDGASTAIDKVLEETGQKALNLTSYCIGGTLAGGMLAYFAKVKDRRVKSATFFTAQLDFEDAGELQVFVDDQTIAVVDEQMDKGYLPAEAMAQAFNMLRASDLIWGYVVNNYLLGKDPFPFDLLYWNSDSTRMAAKVHHFYLDHFYNRNALVAGDLQVGGKSVTLADIDVPVYHIAAKEDHIAPAESIYRGARLMTGAKVRFVLSGSGHIAGVVNPPEMNKYQFWTNEDMSAPDVEHWLNGATETPGSWWPDWDAWLAKHSRSKVAARDPGAVLGTIEDAPGRYVTVRSDGS